MRLLPALLASGLLLAGAATACSVLLDASGSGPVWLAQRIELDGELSGRYELAWAESIQIGHAILTPDGNGWVQAAGWQPTASGVRVQQAVLENTTVRFAWEDATMAGQGSGGFTIWGQGELVLVTWFAGGIGEWGFRLEGHEDALLGATSGADAFVRSARDLSSVAHVEAGATPIHGRAQAAATHEVVSTRSLFAVAQLGDGSAGALVLSGPAGARPCPCSIVAGAPGTYAFDATHAGAGFWDAADVVVTGADVELP